MNFQNLNRIRYEAFKNQDHEMGAFDVIFDIGGKKLYSNKFMLLSISTTFSSMISDRWAPKNVPISIDTYCYDDFYQFLTFLYSGECQLTNDNIAVMIDIAEFFQVSDFKDFCEKFLTKLQCNLENIIQLFEIATKYSLDNLKKSLASFVKLNCAKILNPQLFLQISKDVLLQILGSNFSNSEDIFKKVYEWAEKHAMAKMESDSNLNLEETTKEILADFMPLFDFSKMYRAFVEEFIVGKSLLPLGPELSTILESCYQTKNTCSVEIIGAHGKMMRGQFCDPGNIFDEIQKLNNITCDLTARLYRFSWRTSLQNRPSQRILKRRDGVEWYLVYNSHNDLVMKHRSEINDENNYLIAEMFPEDGFFMPCYEGFFMSGKISVVRL